MNTQEINLKKMSPDLLSDFAEKLAENLKKNKNTNKQTQIRKFYDELSMWNNKVQFSKDKQSEYEKNAIFIKMMKAKVAYAAARKSGGNYLVSEDFKNFFDELITQIEDCETLKNAKLFMEAVMGYCKYFEEKNKNR
ncbi:type III-A CRISPR-associated protein Csm2 [Pasteurella atlantica]|uniref:Type III-A CRISPR-associated protein Csm2 n=2 Tax=Pasteurellaceae TaxID=712 RepID=A0ACC6HPS5_9PAST|nr:type III-A CRISPR-associated protein Csm2 [Pasteurella atlantica]MDP8052789.1 type III-A CRISPR-associated protein Csm2 [Pasteurella atlantica]MDP8101365.1 type III-A CRISPR-associated protein Csm2 [Pasteurella atlantica]MDP8106086.1 type III-A CRISPR-associated protein Csm2 [Pasteurella atlantica]MDP8149466.1 type III-A CRISPR-associated protein Csm2 [Pasteurella atlantica]